MPNFTYTTDIPESNHNPSTDQPDMKVNTNSINSIIDVDHYTFGNNNGGLHKKVTLLNGAAPGFAGGNGAMYAGVINGQTWPIWQNALGSTAMMSLNSLIGGNGYTSLPGQIIIQWGNTTASGSGTRNVLFATLNINFPNNCFHVFAQTRITTITNAIDWSVSNLSVTGFSLGTLPSGTPGGTPFSWFAIGN